jgi:2-polyprenyl-6-methoxyphenol hydroxylase-like FAD-dependent oxidoreductase
MHPHEGNGSREDRRLQIAVAGGSIGGLCAGLALHGSGFDMNVYERHPGPMDTRGTGIVVQGELVQLLDTYGAPPLPTTSCRVRRYLDPQGGDGQVQSMPQAFTSWEAIYETPRAAFPKERYHTGATLVGVNDPGDGQAVSAEIEGHSHIKTDLLVCADGAQSPTPRRLLPDVQSIYAAMSPGAARSTKRMRQKSLCAFSRTPSPSQRPARAGTS